MYEQLRVKKIHLKIFHAVQNFAVTYNPEYILHSKESSISQGHYKFTSYNKTISK